MEGGVLRRAGHTEATTDLARMAGFHPSGVLVEILNDDGTMARVPQLIAIAKEHDMRIITIKDLIAYRMLNEKLIKQSHRCARCRPVLEKFTMTAFEERLTGDVHLAMHKGEWKEDEPVLVRVHSQCVTGDIFGSMRCDCGDQLARALTQIEKEGQRDGPVHEAGRARHRLDQQVKSLQTAGRRDGHRGRKPCTRL